MNGKALFCKFALICLISFSHIPSSFADTAANNAEQSFSSEESQQMLEGFMDATQKCFKAMENKIEDISELSLENASSCLDRKGFTLLRDPSMPMGVTLDLPGVRELATMKGAGVPNQIPGTGNQLEAAPVRAAPQMPVYTPAITEEDDLSRFDRKQDSESKQPSSTGRIFVPSDSSSNAPKPIFLNR